MNKIKIKSANLLLLTVVLLIVIFPQIAFVVSESIFKIDIGKLLLEDETSKLAALIIDQYVFILLPVIVFVIAAKINIRQVFRLNTVNFSVFVLTVFMAIAAWFISIYATLIVNHLYTILFGQSSNAIEGIIPKNMFWGLFLISVTPALCEEALFRGVILKAYENRGTWKAIIISAILFGLIHFSIIRFVGPFLIGILAAYLVVRSNSIIPAIITHFIFNGTSIILFYLTKEMPQEPSRLPTLPEYMVLTILFIFVSIFLAICLTGFIAVTSPEGDPSRKRSLIYRFFLGRPKEKPVFMKSISSSANDFAAVFSNWTIVIIIAIFIVINILEVVAIK